MRDTFRRLELAGVKCTIDTHRTSDGGNVTMWNLIPRKLMPPTRWMRYCRAFARMLAERTKRGLDGSWKTGEDVFHAWMEDGVLPGQMVLEGMEDI